MTGWAAYLCSQRGYHERRGASNGTVTVWFSYCAVCGAWIGQPVKATT